MIKKIEKELIGELKNLFESKAEDFITQASSKFSNQREELESFFKKIEELSKAFEGEKEDFDEFLKKIDNVKKIEVKIKSFNKKYLEAKKKIIEETKAIIDKAIKQTIIGVKDEVERMVETFNFLKEEGALLKENIDDQVLKIRVEAKKQQTLIKKDINEQIKKIDKEVKKQQVNLKKYIKEQIDNLRKETFFKVNQEIEESKQYHIENKSTLEELKARIKEIEKATIHNTKFSKKYNK